jgi:hypothetical protein
VSARLTKPSVCGVCGAALEQPATGRPRRYCPDRPCRQRAWDRQRASERRRRRVLTKLEPPAAPIAPAIGAGTRASWKALRAELKLTDDELRAIVLAQAAEAGFGNVDARTLTDRAARARIQQSQVSAEDRRLFAEAERAEAGGAAV